MPRSICRNKHNKNNKRNKFITVAFSLALVFAVWAIAARLVGKDILLPGPVTSFRALAGMMRQPQFWSNYWTSFLRGLTGFGIAFVSGTFMGMLTGLNASVGALFRPVLAAIRSTPSMSFILLALIWFRSETVVLFVTFMVVFPIVAQNVAEGTTQIDRDLIDMAGVYKVSSWRVLWEIRVPAMLPYLAAAAATGIGLTWKVLISAEVLASPVLGIGAQMDRARVFLNTPEVFAWTAVVVITGFLFDWVLDTVVRKKLFFWK
ncbi:MAG TPA: hypothetical protein DDX03_01670 [Firmicutes bacterium]|nr:hypothetical protein [Bacillota bacterium]